MMREEDNTNASSKRQPYQDVPISNEVGLSRSSGRHAGDVTGSSTNPSPRAVQNPQSKNFEIVLVTDNESRRQVRRHAMRQYMRQRRLDSIARLETPRLPIGGWVSRQVLSEASTSSIPPSPVEVPIKDTSAEEEKLSPVKDGEPCIPESGIGPLMPLASRSSEVKAEEPSSPSFPIVSYTLSDPRSSPGHGAVEDPFSCYPIPVSHSDHELIQHFNVTYPSMMYKFADSVASNPMMEIFRQIALHDNLSFQAMLAIASKHRAGVEGKPDSVQSLTHKMRALRLINERIQTDSQGLQDGTIYAVATMAVIEKWSKDPSIERMHCMGLASMVRNRGGMRGMRASSPFLEKVVYWVDISCAPKAVYTSCLPWTGAVPDTSPESLDFLAPDVHLAIPHTQTAVESSESLCDQYRACEDFLRFFRCLHELEKAALGFPGNVTRSSAAPRIRRFTPGTPLHSILTMLPDYDHGIRDIRFIDEYTCMSCLFFLAVALYDSYRNSTNFDRYLDWLDLEVQKLNPFTNPSITSVLWIFLNNGGYPQGEAGDAGERCWVVSRMVRIAKRLEWKRQGTIWDRLRQVLINFILAQQECALGSDSVDEEALITRQQRRLQPSEYFWDEDEMREEILGSQSSSILTPYPQSQTTIVV
ncbi:uncharacterized protein P174DRAFT_513589 [Aspergillus novofumigatus IBT 16806]|uniref:Uncharacterized protein n=1 Tax=Aspergillus novofumigatus (strain IBT 16806) TaxID=1392255 RepID=A0A2I1C6C2_ASPN1|nr:uncharacterized protein P174DRAFT_513589 [Aspergillus novofumigatus IBT 16806]PKX93177.1 hypothetical protein P174DRAFT_513589 [Aspergillus novofumigatus IBT 16806]